MLSLPPAATIAGPLVPHELAPLPGWSIQGGDRCTRRFRMKSSMVGVYAHYLRSQGATDTEVVTDDGVMAELHARFANSQNGAISSTVPAGGWSMSGAGLTVHIFQDDRFAALDSLQRYALNKLRANPEFDDTGVTYSSDGAAIRALLVAQKDTIEAEGVIVTRRIALPGGWAGTIGWGNVGLVFEDNATFQSSEGAPDSIILEFDRDYQWLMRPFSKEEQRDGSYVATLTYWGAKAWDTFRYPNRL